MAKGEETCEMCGEDIPGYGIAMEPLTEPGGCACPKCLWEAVSKNPKAVEGRIPSVLIGSKALLEMFQTLSDNPEKGRPVGEQ